MKDSNRISSLFFLALSLFVCQQAIVIGVGSLHKPGPGLLSFGAGLGVGCMALGLLIASFISKDSHKEVAQNRSASETIPFYNGLCFSFRLCHCGQLDRVCTVYFSICDLSPSTDRIGQVVDDDFKSITDHNR